MAEAWIAVLAGCLTSVIAVVGSFGLFLVSQRAEARRDLERREREECEQRRQAQTASVARVLGIVAMQPKDMTFAPLYGNAQALALLDACMSFVAVNGGRHPAVARWVMEQHGRVLEARSAYWRKCWLLVGRKSALARWAGELGTLAGELHSWEVGTRDDVWFADRLALPAEKCPSPAVSPGQLAP